MEVTVWRAKKVDLQCVLSLSLRAKACRVIRVSGKGGLLTSKTNGFASSCKTVAKCVIASIVILVAC